MRLGIIRSNAGLQDPILDDILSRGIHFMSVMQRVEHGFYGLTRLLSILLTIALLACAVFLAKSWLDVTAPTAKPATPTVTAEDVVAQVVANDGGAASDPNHAAYERMQKAIVSFASKYNVSADLLDTDSFTDDVKTVAADQANKETTAAYANGAADMLDRALTDPRIEVLVKKNLAEEAAPSNAEEKRCADAGAINIALHELIEEYRAEFLQKSVPSEASELDQSMKQYDTMRSLARIGGPLFLLLLILQVLAFGRVDQSLRDIAHKQGG